jgi:hypothetical protein
VTVPALGNRTQVFSRISPIGLTSNLSNAFRAPCSTQHIQPPQPRRDKGLAVDAANPFDVSAPVLHPLHRVTDDVRRAPTALAEHQAIQLPRFGCVGIGHQMPVAVERRLDRGVAELCLDVFRVGLSFAKTLSARLIDLRSVWGLEMLETGTRCPSPKPRPSRLAKPFSSSPWVRAGSRRQEVVALAGRRKTRFSVRQRTVGGRQRKDGARSGWGPSGVLDYAAWRR